MATDTIGNPNDPWTLTSGSYDPATFYVRAGDGNGHASLIHVKVSPALLGQMQHLVQSRAIPQYRTYADLVRDAVIHRLRYLSDLYPDTMDLHALEIEQKQAELDRLKIERDAWKKLIGDIDAQLTELIQNNEFDEAEWLIEQNEWSESMTPSYLKKLTDVLAKHRKVINKRMTG